MPARPRNPRAPSESEARPGETQEPLRAERRGRGRFASPGCRCRYAAAWRRLGRRSQPQPLTAAIGHREWEWDRGTDAYRPAAADEKPQRSKTASSLSWGVESVGNRQAGRLVDRYFTLESEISTLGKRLGSGSQCGALRNVSIRCEVEIDS